LLREVLNAVLIAVRGGAVLDGTEIAALLISKRGHLLRVGDVILLFNVVLFLLAMTVLGVNQALYSIVTYFAAARTLDFVLYGLDEFTAITIVSDQHAPIRDRITGELGRGVTVYRGYGGMSGVEQDILYCVVTRLEIGKVKAIVRRLDPQTCPTRRRGRAPRSSRAFATATRPRPSSGSAGCSADRDYGGRGFSCRDLEGHLWSVGTFDPWEPEKA
jgi:hypothetical protein